MSPGKRVVVLMLLVVSCLIAYGSRPIPASATAGINSNISFTGKLVKSDNTNITDGTYNMEFKVYQDGTNTGVGSTLLWTEDYLVAGSTGMPSTGGVTFSSGTFSVNLASICAFAGGTCGAKTNTGIDFNQNTLWVSVQIGNTTSCTVTSSTTSFNTACGGDGEMSPYIRLTAVPYAANAALLSGIAVTALGQLASNQTWTGTNTFQPTTNISSALIKQTSVASPTADIFNVQTANATTLLQFTGPSANASNIVLQSAGASSAIGIGTNAIANTIQIGNATTVNTGNTQTIGIGNISVAGTTNVTIGATTGATGGTTIAQGLTALTLGNAITPTITVQGASAGTIGIGSNAVATTIQIGQNGANAVVQGINIGNGSTGSTTNVTIGNTIAGTTTIQNSATINLNAGIILGNVAAQTLFNTVATSANILGAATSNITFGGAAGNTTFGNTGAYTLQGVSGQAFTVTGQGASTVSLDTGSTGTVNVGTSANNKTINLGPTGATVAAVAVNIATSTGAAQNIKLGGVGTNSTTSNAATTIALQGGGTVMNISNAGIAVTTYNNSATGFQIQNATGAAIVLVDTTSTAANGTIVNYLSYPGFESGSFSNASAGWLAVGSTLTQNTNKANAYHGLFSAQIVTTGINQGLTTSSFTTAPPTATTYIVSFFAKVSAATMASTLFTVTSTDGASHSCSPSAGITLNPSGFQRLFCQLPTTTGVMTALQITQNDATARTIYIDSVQLQNANFNGATITTPSPYQIGGIMLRGVVQNPITILPNADSTTVLQVYNAAGNASILSVDTLNKIIQVGSNVTDATQVLLQLDSFSTFADTASCSTTTNQGSVYYNTSSNTIRACTNGGWEDLVSTAGLGLLIFGVVPDSGSGAGDIGAITGATNGPCRVSFLTTTTVKIVQGCTAYSGGRKVIIPDNTTPTGSLTFTNGNFIHVCLTGTNNQPAFSTSGAEAANMPTFSANNPVLCLADIKTTNSVLASIYDVRTFTTTNKTFATLNAVTGILGGIVTLSATANVVQLGSAIAQINAQGVIIVTAGSAATNNTVNMIIATGGPQYVKATGTSALGSYVQAIATAGYTSTAAVSTNAYSNLGVANRTIDTLCTLTTNCQFSQLTNIAPR